MLVDARLHRPVGFRNPGGFDYPAHLRREGILLVGHARADRITALTPDAPPWPVAVKRWAVGVIARAPAGDLGRAARGPAARRARGAAARDRRELPAGRRLPHPRGLGLQRGAARGRGVRRRWPCAASRAAGPPGAAAVVLVGFALVVGGQPSVLRATVMGLLLLAALLLDRESQLPNALALAVLALLLWRPGDLWEPGFQLSFAATAGIVYLGPGITARLVAPRRAALARGGGRGEPGRAGRGDAAHAGPLQSALADRRGRQPARGAARRGGDDPRHARAAGRAGLERARRAALPRALAGPDRAARGRRARGRRARRDGPPAGAVARRRWSPGTARSSSRPGWPRPGASAPWSAPWRCWWPASRSGRGSGRPRPCSA